MFITYRELIEEFGNEDAVTIIHCLGGKRCYIPKPTKLNHHHKLSKMLGAKLAHKFCELYNGSRVQIPNGARFRRPLLVTLLNSKGVNVREISFFANCTQRQVQNILSKPIVKI